MRSDLLAVATLLSTASATALPPNARHQTVALMAALKRATDQNNGSYAPSTVDCPSDRPTIRDASDGLSPEESQWLKKRRSNIEQPMRDFLGRVDIQGLDTDNYLDKLANSNRGLPTVAIAASGGGYRAMLNGAGGFAAFDDRVDGTTEDGHLGGLLQSATYVAGLSGGGWLMGSMFVNNFTSIQDLLAPSDDSQGNLWQLQNSILDGPDTGSSIDILDTANYYVDLQQAVSDKQDAGYDTSLTDYWGRALSYQLVDASHGGPGYTWSSIAEDELFAAGKTPMPFLVADGRNPGQKLISLNTTVFEFTPWELGSWDPTLGGFVPLKYVGSDFQNGQVSQDGDCVEGFDNVGMVMGTSSSLFNQFILQLDTVDGVPDFVTNAIRDILQGLSQDENDIADWNPNPFSGFNKQNNLVANQETLTLVDGGEDLQNVPFYPLLQPERQVDVVFAIDSSADTGFDGGANWPNGASLVATYERSQNRSISDGSHFPAVPDTNTFLNKGLASRPTFFGCDVKNMTGEGPLIVYLPNAPYEFLSNTSTFKMSYSDEERVAMVSNGYDAVTQGNSTEDKDWPTCVGCAVLHRSMERDGTDMPDVCQKCFDKYCWDGSLDSAPLDSYAPKPYDQLLQVDSGVLGLSSTRSTIAVVAAVVGTACMLL